MGLISSLIMIIPMIMMKIEILCIFCIYFTFVCLLVIYFVLLLIHLVLLHFIFCFLTYGSFGHDQKLNFCVYIFIITECIWKKSHKAEWKNVIHDFCNLIFQSLLVTVENDLYNYLSVT